MIIRSVTFFFCSFGITAAQTTTHITNDEEICGTRVQDDDLERVKIVPTIPGRVPWHVGVHKLDTTTKSDQLICGGTIISLDTVLTAASCVYDSLSSKTYDPNLFRITAGKIESDWTSSDSDGQITSVDEIAVPEAFFGYLKNNADNLALLKLTTRLRLNDVLKPICFDLDSTGFDIQNNYLQTAGWGLDGGVSKWPFLKEASFQYLSNAECINKFSKDTNIRFINDDKICVLTPGGRTDYDTGGGLVYKKENKYHLVGIMSDYINNEFSPATNLSGHLTWINNTLELFNKTERKCKDDFLCHDGSCIHPSLVCDEFNDCPDGSDENQVTCHQIKPANIPTSSCLLPNLPDGGTYTKEFCNTNCELKADAYIEQNQQVQLNCSEGFAPKEAVLNAASYVCSQGRWFPRDPKCIKLCNPLKEPNVNFHCTYKGKNVNCDTFVKPDTVVNYNCNKHYKLVGPSAFRSNLTCIEGGIWKDPMPKCEQECGFEYSVDSDERTQVKYNENITEYGKYPWHVGIFTHIGSNETFDNFCAGTLINEKVVLTAASCLIGPTLHLKVRISKKLGKLTFKIVENLKEVNNISLSGDEMMVAAGKFYRNLDKQEEYQQTSRVSNILIQADYFNYNKLFQQNIALLITKNSFKFSDFVLPVCIDYSQRLDVLRYNTRGTMVGWGTTEEGESTNELREVQFSILNAEICRKQYWVYTYFIRSDKICVPYTTGLGPQTPGAGLTIKQNGRHFLYGVNSINAKQFTEYIFSIVTNVSSHIEWLQGTLNDLSSPLNLTIPPSKEITFTDEATSKIHRLSISEGVNFKK